MIVTAVAIAAVVMSLSSCNRGIGCPSDFSVEQIAIPVVKNVINKR